MRKTRDDDWNAPVNLEPTVNGSSCDGGPSISTARHILYFHSNHPGGSGDMDLWQVSIDPVVDLNGNGMVDATDMCIIVATGEQMSHSLILGRCHPVRTKKILLDPELTAKNCCQLFF